MYLIIAKGPGMWWLGGNDHATDAEWVWPSGEKIGTGDMPNYTAAGYDNWQYGPGRVGRGCLAMNVDGNWHDTSCNWTDGRLGGTACMR